MAFGDLTRLWRSDLYRWVGVDARLSAKVKAVLAKPGLKYMAVWRLCHHLRTRPGIVSRVAHALTRLFLRHYQYKFGISIPPAVQIGEGFYIGHFGTIVVHPDTVIGDRCNIVRA